MMVGRKVTNAEVVLTFIELLIVLGVLLHGWVQTVMPWFATVMVPLTVIVLLWTWLTAWRHDGQWPLVDHIMMSVLILLWLADLYSRMMLSGLIYNRVDGIAIIALALYWIIHGVGSNWAANHSRKSIK